MKTGHALRPENTCRTRAVMRWKICENLMAQKCWALGTRGLRNDFETKDDSATKTGWSWNQNRWFWNQGWFWNQNRWFWNQGWFRNQGPLETKNGTAQQSFSLGASSWLCHLDTCMPDLANLLKHFWTPGTKVQHLKTMPCWVWQHVCRGGNAAARTLLSHPTPPHRIWRRCHVECGTWRRCHAECRSTDLGCKVTRILVSESRGFWLRNRLFLVAESSCFGCGIFLFWLRNLFFWLRKRLFLVAEAYLILVAESSKFGCGSVEIWLRNRTLFEPGTLVAPAIDRGPEFPSSWYRTSKFELLSSETSSDLHQFECLSSETSGSISRSCPCGHPRVKLWCKNKRAMTRTSRLVPMPGAGLCVTVHRPSQRELKSSQAFCRLKLAMLSNAMFKKSALPIFAPHVTTANTSCDTVLLLHQKWRHDMVVLKRESLQGNPDDVAPHLIAVRCRTHRPSTFLDQSTKAKYQQTTLKFVETPETKHWQDMADMGPLQRLGDQIHLTITYNNYYVTMSYWVRPSHTVVTLL